MQRKNQVGCPCCSCKLDRLTAETAISTETVRETEHPQHPYSMWLQAEVNASSAAAIKLLMSWGDSDGLYVEFTPADASNGTLKLFRRDSTQLATRDLVCADQGVWHRITACYDPATGEFTAHFDARDSRGYVVRGQTVTATVPSGFTPGRQAGYDGTGSIRNYKLDYLWYYGTEGTEEVCCEPTIVETQAGQEGTEGSDSVWTYYTNNLHVDDLVTVRFYKPAEWLYPDFIDVSVYYTGDDAKLFDDLVYGANDAWSLPTESVPAFTTTGSNDIRFCGYLEWGSVTVRDVALVPNGYTEGSNSQESLNEIQTLSMPTGRPCSFALTFGGQTTGALTAESTAAQVQAAIESLSTIGESNVSVTGDAGGPFTIEFIGDLALQDVGGITASSVAGCLPCSVDDNYGDYYGECPKTYCHSCTAPDCGVVSETFAGLDDGDMPCGWDAGGTDWEVIDGAATGNGPVSHQFDTTGAGSSYHVAATFSLGELATLGDAVTVYLTHGDVTHSMTVTRVAGENPGDPDRYRYTWLPSGFDATYSDVLSSSVTLTICPYQVCNSGTQTIVELAVTPGTVSVSITQPTLSGHVDAALTGFSITQSKEMNDDCPECQCTTTCSDYCLDSIWPSSWLVEISGLEPFCCSVDGLNRGFYASRYLEECYSYGFGDDEAGVCDPGNLGNDFANACWYADVMAGSPAPTMGAMVSSACSDPSLIALVPSSMKEMIGATTVIHPVRVDVYVVPRSDFSMYPWSVSFPESSAAVFAIFVEVSRLVFRQGSPVYQVTVSTIRFVKFYSGAPDCKNFTEEELAFAHYRELYNTTFSFGDAGIYVYRCSHYGEGEQPSGTPFFFWGKGQLGGFDNEHGSTDAKVLLTAL